MAQPRHIALVALLLLAACGRKGPTPPEGEVRSALAMPTIAGDTFDPASLSGAVTMVTFWSPS